MPGPADRAAFTADGMLLGQFSAAVCGRHNPWSAITAGGGSRSMDEQINRDFPQLRTVRVPETYEQAPAGWATPSPRPDHRRCERSLHGRGSVLA